jgi:16S rRNA (cytosine967-C5)-methyltransferase
MNASSALAPALRDAAHLLARVASGRSLADQSAHGALLDLAHGTLRRYGRVQAIVRALSRRAHQDTLVEALLWCSLYALESGRYAEYTVVDQAVRACALLEKWTAKSYVNALLRGYLRERGSIEARIGADPQARYQHPGWWIDALREAYPQGWEEALAQGNTHPPMCLRVNRRRVRPADCQAELAAAGMPSRRVGADGLLLERAVPAERVPGFAAGRVSVQDAGAQRAAHCLDLAPGQRVLDACAAPGGKAAHLLETEDIVLTAVDADRARCAHISRNLDRLGLAATLRVADATQLAAWWDGAPFDRILADLPCTASGVARRHPDLKWLRRAADVPAFARRHAVMLDALWRVLRPGGKLMYVTCSVFPQENDAVVDAFVARSAGSAVRLALPDGGPAQWLPDAEHDGFFYTLIQRQA